MLDKRITVCEWPYFWSSVIVSILFKVDFAEGRRKQKFECQLPVPVNNFNCDGMTMNLIHGMSDNTNPD